MPLPALRNIDVFPIEHEGQTMLCLHDPEGYAEDQLVMSPLAFAIATLFDGECDIIDVQQAFAREYGGRIATSEDILSIMEYLDEHGFLCSPRFLKRCNAAHDAFAKMESRPAACAGRSYPDDAEELRRLFDDLLRKADSSDAVVPDGLPPLLIVPHIDFARGGAAYGAGYRMLKRCAPPELVLIFGVAHRGGEAPFILTRKDFETPLGTMHTDREVVDHLASLLPSQRKSLRHADEFVHKNEHSVEFQAVWLAHLFGTAPRIVPILCGDTLSGDTRHIQSFLTACRELVQQRSGQVLVIAGADLAHVGACFGDASEVTPEQAREVEVRDREDLAYAIAGDAAGFAHSVLRDDNARRVCGLGCIHAALACVEGIIQQGGLLHYGQAPAPEGGSVSYASIVF